MRLYQPAPLTQAEGLNILPGEWGGRRVLVMQMHRSRRNKGPLVLNTVLPFTQSWRLAWLLVSRSLLRLLPRWCFDE